MALKFGKTTGEIWLERLVAALKSGVILFLHCVLFFTGVTKLPHALGAIVAPVLCWLAWQGVASATVGAAFRVRFIPEDSSKAKDVWDVVFTCLGFVNAAFFLYFVLD